jgi:hypothetical protein
MSTTQAERNAVAFEMSVAAPGWYSGFLVACSCERSQGKRNIAPAGAKLSVREFAKLTHQSDNTIRAYLDAWESAADDELVSHADELAPDDALLGLEFSEVHTAESWLVYFDALMATKRDWQRERDAQRRNPPTPAATAEHIESSPAHEQAARDTIEKIDAKRQLEHAVNTDKVDRKKPPPPDVDQLVDVTIQYRRAKTSLQVMLTHVTRIQSLTDESRSIVVGMVEELRNYLLAIEQATAGRGLDAELAELLKES